MKAVIPAAKINNLPLRAVALPSEHGSWAFLFEPILLSLLVAGSVNGIILSAAVFSAFLIHQPLKLALKDRLKGRRPPRAVWAERFTVGYGLSAVVLFAIVALRADALFAVPLLLALPFLTLQVYYDARNQSRALLPELCGVIALGSTACAIAVLGGWSLASALPLWLIVTGRSIPSILYVRARLSLEHGKPAKPYVAWIAHAAALGIIALLAVSHAIPMVVIAAYGLLFVRALVGLSNYRKARPAKQIGLLELACGFLVVMMAAAGYAVSL